MATKKTTAIAVRQNSNVVSVAEQMKAQVAALAGKTAPVTGNMIRVTQDKKFVLPDGSTIDGTRDDGVLRVVVVDFVSVNKFYEGSYDPNNIAPPACFAINNSPMNMAPSANSPNKQANACNECPMNQFGSAGNAKACKNTRLLALLPPDADESTPLWLMSVSPTALRAWDSYVGSIVRTFNTAPVGVVTEVSLNPGLMYPSLLFGNPEPNENVAVHMARYEEAQALLMTEPDVSGFTEAAPVRGRAPARKVANARR